MTFASLSHVTVVHRDYRLQLEYKKNIEQPIRHFEELKIFFADEIVGRYFLLTILTETRDYTHSRLQDGRQDPRSRIFLLPARSSGSISNRRLGTPLLFFRLNFGLEIRSEIHLQRKISTTLR